MSAKRKTLSMRALEKAGVNYETVEFPSTIHDAMGVAEFAGEPPSHVYKTLVVGPSTEGRKPMLVMIAADRTLDLKKLAHAIGEKRVKMASHADAERLTGLKVGGISALALLGKGFEVYIDSHALTLAYVVVSAGQRGLNLRVPVEGLLRVTGARVADVTGEPPQGI